MSEVDPEVCPHCDTSLLGDPIPAEPRAETPEESRGDHGSRTRRRRQMGWEFEEVWDGVLYWSCPDCMLAWARGLWTEDDDLWPAVRAAVDDHNEAVISHRPVVLARLAQVRTAVEELLRAAGFRADAWEYVPPSRALRVEEHFTDWGSRRRRTSEEVEALEAAVAEAANVLGCRVIWCCTLGPPTPPEECRPADPHASPPSAPTGSSAGSAAGSAADPSDGLPAESSGVGRRGR